jgi:hypothetical protein
MTVPVCVSVRADYLAVNAGSAGVRDKPATPDGSGEVRPFLILCCGMDTLKMRIERE